MIAAAFPTLHDEADKVDLFFDDLGLPRQLFTYAAEAVCDAVLRENLNFDIIDLTLGFRNNAAFRALLENGSDVGLFQKRSKGGKSFITNLDESLKIMLHNTDAATALGAHIPAFLSKRARRGTSYIHDEAQGELDLGGEVIEFISQTAAQASTTVDVCVYAEKVDGNVLCRMEFLVDAKLNNKGDAFGSCVKRYGIIFDTSEFVGVLDRRAEPDDDFENVVLPKSKR